MHRQRFAGTSSLVVGFLGTLELLVHNLARFIFCRREFLRLLMNLLQIVEKHPELLVQLLQLVVLADHLLKKKLVLLCPVLAKAQGVRGR